MGLLSAISNKIEMMLANRSQESKVVWLTKHGCRIGENVHFNCNLKAFGTEPYLIKIGGGCLFAEEIRLITHDGSVRVINNLDLFGDHKRYDKVAPIVIGNNVYLGTGAYVMPGVKIGDNCIIGARAIVTHDIPSNSVAVGIPAKVIESVEEFFAKSCNKGCFEPTVGMSYKDKREFYETKFELK